MLLPNHAVNIQNCTLSVMLLPNHAVNIQTAHCLLCCCQDKQLHIKHCLSDFAMPSVWFHGPVAHKPRARIHTAAHIHILYSQPYPYPISNRQAHSKPKVLVPNQDPSKVLTIPSLSQYHLSTVGLWPSGTSHEVNDRPYGASLTGLRDQRMSLQLILANHPCNLSL